MADKKKEMEEKAKELAKREEAVAKRENEIKEAVAKQGDKAKELEAKQGEETKDLEAQVAELKKALKKKDASLAELLPIDTVKEEPELTKAEKALVKEACEEYGIAEKYIVKVRVEKGEAVIMTVGGAKVRYKEGDEVLPLAAIRIDGIIRKKMKPVTAGKKRSS